MKKIMFLTVLATLCSTNFAMNHRFIDDPLLQSITLPTAEIINQNLSEQLGIFESKEISLGEILGDQKIFPREIPTVVFRFFSYAIHGTADEYFKNPHTFMEQYLMANILFLQHKTITRRLLAPYPHVIAALEEAGNL